MIQPNVTHIPCDLNQQRKRLDARRDSVARVVAWRNGRRSLLDRLLRLGEPVDEPTAEDLRRSEGEDVAHALRI